MPVFFHGIAIERFDKEEDDAIAAHEGHHRIAEVAKHSIDSEDVMIEHEYRNLGKHYGDEVEHVTNKKEL